LLTVVQLMTDQLWCSLIVCAWLAHCGYINTSYGHSCSPSCQMASVDMAKQYSTSTGTRYHVPNTRYMEPGTCSQFLLLFITVPQAMD